MENNVFNTVDKIKFLENFTKFYEQEYQLDKHSCLKDDRAVGLCEAFNLFIFYKNDYHDESLGIDVKDKVISRAKLECKKVYYFSYEDSTEEGPYYWPPLDKKPRIDFLKKYIDSLYQQLNFQQNENRREDNK
jgi:hypothetical protein